MRGLIAITLLSGCSFATMGSVRGSPPKCSSSYIPPVIDTLVTIATPIIATAVIYHQQSQSHETDGIGYVIPALLISLPITTPFGISALQGFGERAHCARYEQLPIARNSGGTSPAAALPQPP